MPYIEYPRPVSEPYLGQSGRSLSAVSSVLRAEPGQSGSRRRRVWELSATAQCPVLGLCLPIAWVHRAVVKHLGQGGDSSDYDVHCALVVACRSKGTLAKLVSDELDRRYSPEIKASNVFKTTDTLTAYWREEQTSTRFVARMWAVLSHPRCDADLEFEVLGTAHMLEHKLVFEQQEAKAQEQSSQEALEQLSLKLKRQTEKYQALQAEWSESQANHQQALRVLNAELAGAQAELARATASAVALLPGGTNTAASDVELIQLKQRYNKDREAWREALASKDALIEQLRSQLSDQRLTDEDTDADLESPLPARADGIGLENRAVLCVGGRQSAIPYYRQLVEQP